MNNKSKYNPNIHHRRSIRLKGYDYSQAGLYFITICCQNRICRFGDVVNGEMVLNEWGQIAFDEWMKTTEIRSNVELGECIIMPNHIHGIIQLLGRGESHLPGNHNQIYTHDGRGESHSPGNHSQIYTHDGRGESHLPGNHNQIYTHDGRGESHLPGNHSQRYTHDGRGESHLPGNHNQIYTHDGRGESHLHQPENTTPNNQGVCDTPLRSPSQTIGAIVRGYKSSVTKQLGLLGLTDKLWQRNYYEHIIRNEQSHQRISNYIRRNPEKWKDDVFFKS